MRPASQSNASVVDGIFSQFIKAVKLSPECLFLQGGRAMLAAMELRFWDLAEIGTKAASGLRLHREQSGDRICRCQAVMPKIPPEMESIHASYPFLVFLFYGLGRFLDLATDSWRGCSKFGGLFSGGPVIDFSFYRGFAAAD
jgi:hypothetical protein